METVIAFLFFSALNIANLFPLCRIYGDLNFDFQALLTWDYSAYLGVIPYKEIFYPYGILSYFKDQNVLIHVLFFLITPVLLTALFIIFKKIWERSIYAYLHLLLVYIFVIRLVGQDGFDRYGIFTVFPLIIGLILYSKKTLTKNLSFIFGVITGYIFSLMSDQGIYIFVGFTVNLYLYPIIVGKQLEKDIGKYYKSAFLQFVVYLIGIIVGIIPLFVYLFKNGVISDFFNFFIKLSDISLYAKTPFPPYSDTPENIFTFAILIIAIFYLSFRLMFKKKVTLNNYLQLNLCFIIIFLEQKSLIRSIDSVITFPSFILFILLLKDLKDKLKVNKKNISYLVLIFITIMLLSLSKNYKNIYKINYLDQNDLCIEMNLNKLFKNDSEYIQVKNLIKEKLGYEGKIFSYPSDPIFYLLFEQVPPYYSNNYDSSAIYAQKKQIEYIEKNNIQFVIYDQKIDSVQDGVPNYIRTPYEMRYIFSNFYIENKIGKFLILRKSLSPIDLFESKILNRNMSFKNYVSNVDLRSIPLSEGLYKAKSLYVNKNKRIVLSGSLSYFNNFLKNNSVSTSNKILKLTSKKYKTKTTIITMNIRTLDGNKSRIIFNKCKIGFACLINLHNIPLFYNERIIKEITLDDFEGNIEVIDNYEDIFW